MSFVVFACMTCDQVRLTHEVIMWYGECTKEEQ